MARGIRLPGSAWKPRDWALHQAVQTLDSSRCAGCGQPTWLSHDPESSWRPRWIKCQSCNAIEELREKAPNIDPKLNALLNGEKPRPHAVQFYTEHVP